VAGAVVIGPYDLATIIDPEAEGSGGTGEIKRGEAAVAIEETMAPSRVVETSRDLATVIDPVGVGTTDGWGTRLYGTGDIAPRPWIDHFEQFRLGCEKVCLEPRRRVKLRGSPPSARGSRTAFLAARTLICSGRWHSAS
jgi:hypothetical protein